MPQQHPFNVEQNGEKWGITFHGKNQEQKNNSKIKKITRNKSNLKQLPWGEYQISKTNIFRNMKETEKWILNFRLDNIKKGIII